MQPIIPFLVTLLLVAGCSAKQQDDKATVASRMERIVRLACNETDDSSLRKSLEACRVFVDIEDLEVPCVGVSVPIDDGGMSAHISFTRDWFQDHTDSEISAALLEDLARSISESSED